MAHLRAVEEGEGRWFTRQDVGLDHGKPVRMKVHALTRAEELATRAAAFGNKKSNRLQNESALRAMARGEEYTREHAIVALDETENYNVELSGPKAVERFSKLLNRTDLKTGDEVCLDGKWTPELKRAFFSEFAFSKSEAREVSNLSSQVAKQSQDEREDADQGFSEP